MTIPTYEQIMLPLLRIARDGKEHSMGEAVDALAEHFKLTEAERTELLPSGGQPKFKNRVGWARTSLNKALLLEMPLQGRFRITERGQVLVTENPPELTPKFLFQRYPEYSEYYQGKPNKDGSLNPEAVESDHVSGSPLERLTAAYAEMNRDLEQRLLMRVKECTPEFFEHLVVDLLFEMGYGGTRRDAAQAIGRSGDGGVDGWIKEDQLGLGLIYVQAKRYSTNSVPVSDLRDFVGAMEGKHIKGVLTKARKGVFLTTSRFSDDNRKYAAQVDGKSLVLVDGEELAKLMIAHHVGTTVREKYEVSELNEGYFEPQDLA